MKLSEETSKATVYEKYLMGEHASAGEMWGLLGEEIFTPLITLKGCVRGKDPIYRGYTRQYHAC